MNFCLALLHTILCDCILFYEVKLRSLYRKTAHIFTKKNRRLNHSKQCEYIRIIFGRLKMSISDGGSLGNREKKKSKSSFWDNWVCGLSTFDAKFFKNMYLIINTYRINFEKN